MTAATATTSDFAAQNPLVQAWARTTATLNALNALVCLVFNLVEHGRDLAFTFRDHVREPGFGLTGRLFGTTDIYVIGTCMRRGVMRSVALYKVLWERSDRDPRVRFPPLRRDRTPPNQGDATAKPKTPVKDTRPKWWQTRDLAYLPTEAEVADEARRRPAGAIVADICLDFGMTPENAGALWDQLLAPIARFGGSLKRFTAEVDRRNAPASRIETPRFEAPAEHQRPNCLSAEERSRDHPPPQASYAENAAPAAEPCTASGTALEQTETAPALHWPVSPPTAPEVAAAAPA